jgi:putative membrane protein
VAAQDEPLWRPEWPVVIILVCSLCLYVKGVRELWRSASPGHGIGRGEAACFMAGWLALALALISPMHALAEMLFTVHMIEHELLMVVAAPLLVLGRPLIAFLWALPRSSRRRFAPLSGARSVRSIWLFVMSPLAAWAIHALALWI